MTTARKDHPQGALTMLGGTALYVGAVTAVNAFGIRVSGRVQLLLTGLLVALLLTAIAVSAPHARAANLHPFAPHGWAGVAHAAALLVWSFAGWETITHLAGEFRNPSRDLPRATFLAVAIIGLLYLGVAGASVLVLGPGAASSRAPLAELLTLGFGGSIEVLAALAGLSLAITAAAGSGPAPLVLLTTGSFVAVYALGAAAALRLLPGRGERRVALAALAAVLGLLLMTGRYMVWPLLLAGAALLYLRLVRAPGSRVLPRAPLRRICP